MENVDLYNSCSQLHQRLSSAVAAHNVMNSAWKKKLEEASFCHIGMCPLPAIVDGTKAPFKVSWAIFAKYGPTFSPASDPSAPEDFLQRSCLLQPCLLGDL